MDQDHDPLEIVWGHLLSRDPQRVVDTFSALDETSRLNIRTHLEQMASQPGWQPEQAASAKAALDALKNFQG